MPKGVSVRGDSRAEKDKAEISSVGPSSWIGRAQSESDAPTDIYGVRTSKTADWRSAAKLFPQRGPLQHASGRLYSFHTGGRKERGRQRGAVLPEGREPSAPGQDCGLEKKASEKGSEEGARAGFSEPGEDKGTCVSTVPQTARKEKGGTFYEGIESKIACVKEAGEACLFHFICLLFQGGY